MFCTFVLCRPVYWLEKKNIMNIKKLFYENEKKILFVFHYLFFSLGVSTNENINYWIFLKNLTNLQDVLDVRPK